MIDRQKLETVLARRFPGASWGQIAAAANAIMGLDEEWEEVECRDLSSLARDLERGETFRLLRRNVSDDHP